MNVEITRVPLPLEVRPRQRDGFRLSRDAGVSVQLLRPFGDPGHVSVGVVDVAERVLRPVDGVLSQRDDRLPVVDSLLQRIQGGVDGARVVVHVAVADIVTDDERLIHRVPEDRDQRRSSRCLRGRHPQPRVEHVVLGRALDQQIDQRIVVETGEVRGYVDRSFGPLVCIAHRIGRDQRHRDGMLAATGHTPRPGTSSRLPHGDVEPKPHLVQRATHLRLHARLGRISLPHPAIHGIEQTPLERSPTAIASTGRRANA